MSVKMSVLNDPHEDRCPTTTSGVWLGGEGGIEGRRNMSKNPESINYCRLSLYRDGK